MEKKGFNDRFSNWAKNSVTFKLLIMGFLILILLIPSNMIMRLINERKNRMNEAIDEISSKWGENQVITGPVITVPYRGTIKTEKGEMKEIILYEHFLPENLNISGTLEPDERYRGIYKVILYTAKLNLTGNFKYPDFSQSKIPEEDILWEDAFLSLGIPDMRGVKDSLTVNWNWKVLLFNPGIETSDLFSSGVSVKIKFDKQKDSNKSFKFKIPLTLKGSKMINFLPLGKTTEVILRSNWGNPSFKGSFLPDSRNVSSNGFTANWKILDLNRNFQQSFPGNKYMKNQNDFIPEEINKFAFGVSLFMPVDEYQKTTRSAKYDILFIFLTFLIFFFVEIIHKKSIHPIQYLLVGFAITLFYVILLSLSEYISFNLAYLIASIGILSLVTFYSVSVFKSAMLSVLICLILAILYAFFFVILQMQDYALLFGSIGLFVVLAFVMYLSRNIDWYSIGTKKEENQEE